jgi:integrase
VPRKRSNAEGAIYYSESDKRWEASIVVGRKPHKTRTLPDGSPVEVLVRRKFTGRTRKIVTDKLDAAKKAIDQGLDVPDNRTTLAAFTGWWLDNVMPAEGLAPATDRYYRDVLNTYVVPNVGHRTLTGPNALTVGDVEAMTGKLLAAKKSPRTQVAARVVLGKVLRAAEQRGLVARNVARLAKRPKDSGKARKVKALTPAQVAALLKAVEGTRWRPLVVVGVTTGLRPQELLALHWTDVRLTGKEPQLSVRHALSHVGGATLKAPKRHRSYRTVPLATEAVDALKAWKRDQATERLAAGPLWSRDWPDLVFTNEAGMPVRVDTYRHGLRGCIDKENAAALEAWTKAGARGDKPTPLPHTTPHQLRHSYATHLLEAGVPVGHVAELVGDSIAVLEATYSHVLRTKHEVTSVVSGVLGG